MVTTNCLCRTSQNSRVYQKPGAFASSGQISRNVIFTSYQEATVGEVLFYEISEIEDVSLIGKWIPASVLDIMPIEETPDTEEKYNQDDSVSVTDTLIVNSTNILIYDTYESSTPIKHRLTLKDSLQVDRKVNVTFNGITETRYRIINYTAIDTDQDYLIGKWITKNSAVSSPGDTIRYHTTNTSTPKLQSRILTPAPTNPHAAALYGLAAGASVLSSVFQSTSSEREEIVDNWSRESFAGSFGSSGRSGSFGNVKTTNDTIANMRNTQNQEELMSLYDEYGIAYNNTSPQNGLVGTPIGRMIFVHGMPFQYTYLTDRRAGSTRPYGQESIPDEISVLRATSGDNIDMYGRTFAKEIAANMPIATIVPGKPKFLTTVKDSLLDSLGTGSARDNFFGLFGATTDTEINSAIDTLTNTDDKAYQYYTMEIDTADYFKYVNSLCQMSAKLMGIGEFIYHGQSCGSLDWGKYNSSADQDYSLFEEIVGADGGVSFAFDPMSSITDNLSNTTGESQFASFLNGISSKAREVEFVTGYSGVQLDFLDSEQYEAAVASSTEGLFSSLRTAVDRISAFASNAARGMNVRFPQIWNESSYNKSYDIDMRFITPYATRFCKWRYVLVPFFHLFCLAAPRSPDTVMNYKRPFLIRAFSKGYFNVEMGIIESIQWKRFGDGDMISEDGIPTQIDVTISFQDLYQQLAISHTNGISEISVFFNNTGLMDMLGTLSGVNMNKIDIGERFELYAAALGGTISSLGSNFMRNISDRVRNVWERYMMGT